MENPLNQISEINNAKEQLPAVYEPVTEEFLEKYKAPLDTLRGNFKSRGGIHLATVDDYHIIFKVPSQRAYSMIRKRAEKLEPFEADMLLLGENLLYPRIEVVQAWIESGAFGLVSVFALEIVKATKATQEATVKKI
ncbi:MAG: hypothetical protein H7A25_22175 [Leptospiraceae bacterium]|nr:hypothetical protein [Leptospiraceae bacterium]